MIEFTILDHADQQFGVVLNNRRVTFRFRYNTFNDRWSFDLSLDDLPVLYARRVVVGVDLLAAFNFGIGAIVAVPTLTGAVPDRRSLVDGTVKLFGLSDDELAAL